MMFYLQLQEKLLKSKMKDLLWKAQRKKITRWETRCDFWTKAIEQSYPGQAMTDKIEINDEK